MQRVFATIKKRIHLWWTAPYITITKRNTKHGRIPWEETQQLIETLEHTNAPPLSWYWEKGTWLDRGDQALVIEPKLREDGLSLLKAIKGIMGRYYPDVYNIESTNIEDKP